MNLAPLLGSPQWRLLEQDGRVVATAGADDVWVIDDAVDADAVVAELAACWSDEPPTPDRLSAPARLIAEQLRSMGALRLDPPLTAAFSVRTLWIGDPVAGWPDAFAAAMGHQPWRPTDDPASDFLVVIRTTGHLAHLVDLAAEVLPRARLHLLVDLASARTIALGPMGIPGHTACAGCLATRVLARWGDPVPPPEPGATQPAALTVAAGLVAAQLERTVAGDLSLVDRTSSLDLRTLTSTDSPCLRTPRCPCHDIVSDGRLELPW